MTDFDPIFALVREAAPPAVWSLGVELTRKASVVVESQTDELVVLTIAVPGKALSSTVKIWLADEDWHCDCGRKADACEHVAASVITLRRAKETGKPLTPPSTVGRIRYDFTRNNHSLALQRQVETAEGVQPLKGSLHLQKKSGVVPSQADASIDSSVADVKVAVLPPRTLWTVLTLLKGSAAVTLDGKALSVGRALFPFQIVIEDGADGAVKVFRQPLAAVSEIFENGALIHDGNLCPAETYQLAAHEVEVVEKGKVFAAAQFTDLVSKVLPGLEKHFAIVNRSKRMKVGEESDTPRVIVQSSAAREILAVLPLLVYGDPPYARVDGSTLTLIGDSGKIPRRQLDAEARALTAFRTKTGLSAGKRAEFRGDSALVMADRFAEYNMGKVGDGFKLFSTAVALKPRLNVQSDSFQFAFETERGESVADAREVLRSWREGRERVALLNGGWATVPKEWLEKHGHTVLDLLETREKSAKLPTFAKVALARLCESLESPCPADLSLLRKSLEGFAKVPVAALPADLTAELRPYQRLGVDWLQFLRRNGLGALLADDMGLGKTLQTVCVLKKRSLVVAPTSVLGNWQKEIARFRPNLKVAVHHGAQRELDEKADVTLTSYSLLRRDVEELTEVEWDAVVLDEAQNIKNPHSQAAQSAFGLKAKFRIALSGTPVENRIEDLWSLFHFTNPGLLGSLSSFQDRYNGSGSNADLRAKTKPFVLRRLKREVVPELPPRTEVVLDVEFEKHEKDLYDAVHASAQGEVIKTLNHGGGVMAALECLLRLRQAACHPALLPGQTAPDSSKLQLLREKLEEVVAEGHKALVFSQWTSLLDLLEPTLKAQNLSFLRIDGSVTAENRMKVVDSFQSEGGPSLLLMTLKAGGVGLNLTAADHVFLIDPWWNPAAEDQAADRAHRIGQDKPVFIHRLVTRGTVEEKILALQQMKRATAASALEGSTANSITREDLLELLR